MSLAAGVALIGIGMAAWGVFAPGAVKRECYLKAKTGLPCPLCGGTRASAALVRGHPVEAIRRHAVVAVLLPVMTAGGVLALAVPGKRDKILRGLYVFAGTMGWIWLVYWVVRLARALTGGDA